MRRVARLLRVKIPSFGRLVFSFIFACDVLDIVGVC
jgi:hypothetical protein